MVGRMMKKKAVHTEPGALTLIEQAVHMLRRNNAASLAEYYLGTLPFVLALLYFWSDMSGNPMAGWYCGPSAAGVALLFVWMKVWQVRFCRRLWCSLQEASPEKWSWNRLLTTIARQTALHATGVVALPLAAIILLPLGWVYAFYQNISVLDDGRSPQIIKLARLAKEQAVLWPGQNHLALTMISFFGAFVLLNLAVGIVFLPYLLKSILGVETTFTLSGMRLINTTFFAVLGGLTYLCVDPILKTIYVLRCFYGRSRRTGDDLKSMLRPFLKAGVTAILVLAFSWPNIMAIAAEPEVRDRWKPTPDFERYADRLDGQIETVLENRRFAWRLPREEVPEPPEDQGWISATVKWVGSKTKAGLKIIGGWIKDLLDWMIKKMPGPEISRPTDTGDYRELIRWVFYALGFALVLLLLYWAVRWLRNSRPVRAGVKVGQEGQTDVDLTDEGITAQDLPLDRWLAMARKMADQKDYRSALRALYLSVLAILGDHQRVKIARYKSNREYARELARRAHAEPELLNIFDWCIHVFERSWYGMHPVERQHLEKFYNQQERIAALVQSNA